MNKKLTISCTVTNDLSQDQRMNRICTSLSKNGYAPELIGRLRKKSLPLKELSFKRTRINCFFEYGKLFYIEYNLRLLLFLLFTKKYDAYCAIDLDTLIPNLIVSKLKNKPLIYDAHEYFTELEEVVSRPLVKKIWEWVETTAVPKANAAYTVSEGYKNLFESKYNQPFGVIRNATVLKDFSPPEKKEKYILYQGAVNFGRGLEEVLEAMHLVDCKLIICGEGDILSQLKEEVHKNNLQSKVEFKGFLLPEDLKYYTERATIGLTLFSKAGLSNKFSLANRFFDYFHNGIPQLAMAYPEYIDFNKNWEVAALVTELTPREITKQLNLLLSDKDYYQKLSSNCLIAKKENNWQGEEKKLIAIYNKLLKS